MTNGRLRCRILQDWSMADHRLFLVRDTAPGKIQVAQDFVWREDDEGMLFDPNDGIMRADPLIQAIMNEAWERGFRPVGFGDIKNETAALREHLKDMRKVAFHKLGIEE